MMAYQNDLYRRDMELVLQTGMLRRFEIKLKIDKYVFEFCSCRSLINELAYATLWNRKMKEYRSICVCKVVRLLNNSRNEARDDRMRMRRNVCFIPEKNNTHSSFSSNLSFSLLVQIEKEGKPYYMVITN